jgi:hypothetical protein
MRALLTCLILLLPACRHRPRGVVDLPPPFEKSGVSVSVTDVLRTVHFYQGVAGTAVNVSGRDLRSCTLHFEAYDIDGTEIATATAVREGFPSGAQWRFRARFTPPRVPRLGAVEPIRVEVER